MSCVSFLTLHSSSMILFSSVFPSVELFGSIKGSGPSQLEDEVSLLAIIELNSGVSVNNGYAFTM